MNTLEVLYGIIFGPNVIEGKALSIFISLNIFPLHWILEDSKTVIMIGLFWKGVTDKPGLQLPQCVHNMLLQYSVPVVSYVFQSVSKHIENYSR